MKYLIATFNGVTGGNSRFDHLDFAIDKALERFPELKPAPDQAWEQQRISSKVNCGIASVLDSVMGAEPDVLILATNAVVGDVNFIYMDTVAKWAAGRGIPVVTIVKNATFGSHVVSKLTPHDKAGYTVKQESFTTPHTAVIERIQLLRLGHIYTVQLHDPILMGEEDESCEDQCKFLFKKVVDLTDHEFTEMYGGSGKFPPGVTIEVSGKYDWLDKKFTFNHTLSNDSRFTTFVE